MERFSENDAEQRMAEIIETADGVLARIDKPGVFGEEIESIVADLDKPELSSRAEGYLREIVEKVKGELDESKQYEDGEIEAVVRRLLESVHATKE